MRGILACAFALAVAAPQARADDSDSSLTFHKGQFGLSARFALGLRGIATYDNQVYCGVTDSNEKNGFARVCTGRAPVAFDLEGAYGVAQHIELMLELRIGVERDFGVMPGSDGPHPLQLSPGARFFFSEAAHAKLFVTGQLVFDLADYAGRGKDFGVRSMQGYWIDFHRTYGLYFFVRETAEFARWLEADLEAGIGFQGRYP